MVFARLFGDLFNSTNAIKMDSWKSFVFYPSSSEILVNIQFELYLFLSFSG